MTTPSPTPEDPHARKNGGLGYWAGVVACRSCAATHVAVIPAVVADLASECSVCGVMACYPYEQGVRS